MLIPIITPIVLLILFWGYWSQLFSEKSIMSGDDFSRKRRFSGNGGGKKRI